eukprot:CAMPEP_0176217814 /NCGR_PEP_ID=MMETSP0121_2-20121125/17884_1 /TAXON_ID=160619 /ORGANISM="Kryptoperidinium foliaceum, Strain CCMP 1326" /LENGTH=58 /DNA_ID=CAMNT_0017556951 /DNA_START=112 /DNA_END=285 /DNA_ORIENTATION=+
MIISAALHIACACKRHVSLCAEGLASQQESSKPAGSPLVLALLLIELALLLRRGVLVL